MADDPAPLLVTQAFAGRIRQAVERTEHITGPVTVGPRSISIHPNTATKSGSISAPSFTVLFPVRVTSDGGVSGTNKTTKCTFTYTVKDHTNTTTLGAGVPLTGFGNGWSNLKLKLVAGTYGMAHWDTNGNIVLLFVDESPDGEMDCT